MQCTGTGIVEGVWCSGRVAVSGFEFRGARQRPRSLFDSLCHG